MARKRPQSHKKSQILEITFPGGKIADGKITAARGFHIVVNRKGGGVIKRKAGGGPGVTIQPCECALEGNGRCVQVTQTDDNGDIRDLW